MGEVPLQKVLKKQRHMERKPREERLRGRGNGGGEREGVPLQERPLSLDRLPAKEEMSPLPLTPSLSG